MVLRTNKDELNIEQIKAIIFDLDGTLYDDTGHFSYYAARLKEKLPQDKQAKFTADYEKALNNEHTLKIGRIYDVKRDLILVQDERVREAYKWTGQALSTAEIAEIYSEPVTLNNQTMLNVGDLWWIPAAIARHYGLDDEKSYQSFLETRDYMKGPDYQMNQVPGLKKTLTVLKGKVKLILITNSPEPDSEIILDKLGLSTVFDKKVFNAQKPTLAKEQIQKISREFAIDYPAILSIGDNFLNEILPARELGCNYLFIDQYGLGLVNNENYWVDNCQQAVKILKNFKRK